MLGRRVQDWFRSFCVTRRALGNNKEVTSVTDVYLEVFVFCLLWSSKGKFQMSDFKKDSWRNTQVFKEYYSQYQDNYKSWVLIWICIPWKIKDGICDLIENNSNSNSDQSEVAAIYLASSLCEVLRWAFWRVARTIRLVLWLEQGV